MREHSDPAQVSFPDLLNELRGRRSIKSDKMAIAGAAGSPPTHLLLLSAWPCGCRCDEELPRRMPRRTSAGVSLADRRPDLPEMTSRIVGETAGCQGRVSACQWRVPFHGMHTQSCRGRVGVPSASASVHISPMRLIERYFNKTNITIRAKMCTPRTAARDATPVPSITHTALQESGSKNESQGKK